MPGVVSRRADLRARGLSDSTISRRAAIGLTLRRIGFDAYVEVGVEPTAAEHLAAPGRGAALCREAAALVWGLPVADPARLQLLVRHGGRRRPGGAVVVHQSRDPSVVRVDGVMVTDVLTTLGDLLRWADEVDAVAAVDAATHAGLCAYGDLADSLAGRRPRAVRARRLLALSDGRAESPLETRLRLLLVLAGLAPDDVQHEVREKGRFVARVDLWYDGVVVEADGFAFHADRLDYRRDRRKGQAFARLGLLVLRFSWEDVVGAPDAVVATVRAALRRRAA